MPLMSIVALRRGLRVRRNRRGDKRVRVWTSRLGALKPMTAVFSIFACAAMCLTVFRLRKSPTGATMADAQRTGTIATQETRKVARGRATVPISPRLAGTAAAMIATSALRQTKTRHRHHRAGSLRIRTERSLRYTLPLLSTASPQGP